MVAWPGISCITTEGRLGEVCVDLMCGGALGVCPLVVQGGLVDLCQTHRDCVDPKAGGGSYPSVA